MAGVAYWDREKIVRALQAHYKRWGRAPTRLAWHKGTPGRGRPTSETVAAVFGSWSAAVAAAGLEPRPPGGQVRERCDRHEEEKRVRPDGKHECRSCRRETQRRRRRRWRTKRTPARCLWCRRWFDPVRKGHVYCERSCSQSAVYHVSQGGESPRAAASEAA